MKILLIGGGGREHALAWHLSRTSTLYSTSENPGILQVSQRIRIPSSDLTSLSNLAAEKKFDLIVIGPEQPLVDGLVDSLAKKGIPAFGPTKAAAQLEGSKIFAKQFMNRHKIPTARFAVAEDPSSAVRLLKDFNYPVVLKADGLAAGKGVIVASGYTEAEETIHSFMIEKQLGDAGSKIVIEECLIGRELSYLIFTDNKDYISMPVAQDHKRAFDGDKGPNTGGMGAFSTPTLLDLLLEKRIREEIVEPTLNGLNKENLPFRGTLYFGLMITNEGPRLLEYNVRLGDPETQTILPRLASSLSELTYAVAKGELSSVKPKWSNDSTCCIVLASKNYPSTPEVGKIITGINNAQQIPDVVVFHAGTKQNEKDEIVSSGGRVLNVVARGKSLLQATSQAYEAINQIHFDGMHFRTDIGIGSDTF